MENLTASTTVSNEHETPWSTANADAHPSVAAQTPEEEYCEAGNWILLSPILSPNNLKSTLHPEKGWRRTLLFATTRTTTREQNLAVISTSKSHVADVLYKVRELSLGQRVYPITTYFAAPDISCKGIVPGLVPGTPSSTLVDELLTPGTQILQAHMMGQTNATFEGLKVPHYVRFYGAELHCYPHRPRQLVCKICHPLGHWADHCPTPHVLICATCGTDNPAPSHPCNPHCRSCDGSHPTSDPNCPRRAHQTPNKAWVRKALKKEQRELQPPPPPHIYCFQRYGNDWTLTSLDTGDTASTFEVSLEIPSQIPDPFQASVQIPRSINAAARETPS
ncbi:hypothetical protein MRX96_052313 [Rhipicephalus microplus]